MKMKQTVARAQVGVSCKERETPSPAAMFKGDEQKIKNKNKTMKIMEESLQQMRNNVQVFSAPQTRLSKSSMLLRLGYLSLCHLF